MSAYYRLAPQTSLHPSSERNASATKLIGVLGRTVKYMAFSAAIYTFASDSEWPLLTALLQLKSARMQVSTVSALDAKG